MHWTALILAALALMLGHMLRAPGRSRKFTGAAFFVAAFLVTSFGVRVLANQAQITRPTEYDQFVTYAAQQVRADPDVPVVVFVGASFSRNAVDDVELTQQLRAAGYPHRVVNLSLQGASLQERDAHLWQFMRLSGIAPDVVFLEVSGLFDQHPTYVFNVAKFSDRAIEQFDPGSAFWSVKGLVQGQCYGLVDCGRNWALLQTHAVMNLANLGLLSTGRVADEIAPFPAFDPQDTRRDSFTWQADEIAEALNVPAQIAPQTGPSWARLFRMDQRDRLREAGVRRIAYYYPPVLEPEDRQYVARLCAGELSDYPCIAPVDQALLSQLEGEVWFDHEHLLRPGADVYTAWLASQIDQWGALQ